MSGKSKTAAKNEIRLKIKINIEKGAPTPVIFKPSIKTWINEYFFARFFLLITSRTVEMKTKTGKIATSASMTQFEVQVHSSAMPDFCLYKPIPITEAIINSK